MGLILDSNVLIQAERNSRTHPFSQFADYGTAYISAITVPELLVGVHLANSEGRQNQRKAFVEGVLTLFPALEFSAATARIHSELYGSLRQKGELIGAHDLIIAATALQHGFAVLTGNGREFKRIPGLTVIPFVEDE
ncbi:type II toxin-antitoxin system VapC family toxin [Altericista sp. CCNU0014]|uniref:type II toxin-antitoxin system VapC family toxin n=1 Tax=Altericista sp. CCNU0014 TaxID=3082949 RepID=UPI0038508403